MMLIGSYGFTRICPSLIIARMDSLNSQYRDVVAKVLKDYADFLGSDDQVQVELVFDQIEILPIRGDRTCC